MQLKLQTQISLALILYFCVVCAPVFAYDTEPETGSFILTEKDFNGAVKDNAYLLVNFHALWCRYSKKLKPEWEKLSKTLETQNSEVKLAKVEAYDEKNLANEFKIEGYPTIKLFINGNEHAYNGERTEEHILEFLNRMTKKPLSKINGESEVNEKLKEYEWVGVFFGKDDNSAILDTAFEVQDVFFAVGDSALKTKYGVSDGEFVLVSNISKTFDRSNEINKASLLSFINTHKFPVVANFGKATAERVFLSEEPSMILIKKNNEAGNKAEEEFKKASGSLRDQVFMSVANYEDEMVRLLAQNIGVDESELPTVRIIKADKERIRKYYLDKAITSTSIVTFFEDYTAGVAKRSYLSEPVPSPNNDIVQKIVTKNFEEFVLNNNKDVLVLFWTPWCGHCRAMMPVFDNVGRKTREVKDFAIAKIDVSVNDVEKFGLDIVEYPTILLFKGSDKKRPVEFQGERNEYVFNDFIRAHASVNLGRMKGPNPFDKNEL